MFKNWWRKVYTTKVNWIPSNLIWLVWRLRLQGSMCLWPLCKNTLVFWRIIWQCTCSSHIFTNILFLFSWFWKMSRLFDKIFILAFYDLSILILAWITCSRHRSLQNIWILQFFVVYKILFFSWSKVGRSIEITQSFLILIAWVYNLRP